MKRLILWMFLTCFTSVLIVAQVSVGENFFERVQEGDKYWSKQMSSINKSGNSINSKGYRNYCRWKSDASHFVDGEGSFETYKSVRHAYLMNKDKSASSFDKRLGELSVQANWSFMGPVFDVSTQTHSSSGKGEMVSIWVDPNDYNKVISGSMGGGLWKTTNGGDDWTCLTDVEPIISGVRSFCVSPNNQNEIFILSHHDALDSYIIGVFKSSDGGNSWTHKPVIVNGVQRFPTGGQWSYSDGAAKIMYDPYNLKHIYVLTHHHVYRSTNSGDSWTMVYEAPDGEHEFYDMEFSPIFSGMFFITGKRLLRFSGDYPTDITQSVTGLSALRNSRISVHNNHPNKMWLIYNDGENCYIRKTQANFYSSELLTQTDKCKASGTTNFSFEISPNNENQAYFAGVQHYMYDANLADDKCKLIAVSSNNIPSERVHVDCRDMTVFNNNGVDLIFKAHDGGVSYGVDRGGRYFYWTDISDDGDPTKTGLNVTQFYGFDGSHANADILYGGARDNGGYLYDGTSWNNSIMGGDQYGCMVDDVDPTFIYSMLWGADHELVTRSSNSGKSFSSLCRVTTDHDLAWASILVQHPTQPEKMYHGTYNGSVLYFSNARASAAYTEVTTGIGEAISAIGIAKSNPNIMYAGSKRYFYNALGGNVARIAKSTNGGLTWSIVGMANYQSNNFRHEGWISDIVVDPYNSNIVYVSLAGVEEGTRVVRSVNGGSTWSWFGDRMPSYGGYYLPVYDLEYDEINGYLYAATDDGVYVCEPSNNAWFSFNDCGMDGKIVRKLDINYDKKLLRAATTGRGIWETSLNFCPEVNSGNLSGIVSSPIVYRYYNSLSSTQDINSGRVRYQTGGSITLQPGFDSGSDFTAEIYELTCVSCTSTSSKRLNEEEVENETERLLEEKQVVYRNGYSIYPNPNNGFLTIEFGEHSPTNLTLHSMNGELLRSETISGGSLQMNFTDLPKGVYILKFAMDGELKTEKIIYE